MLLQYAREHHFPNPTFFVDDGVSGVTYDRPGFQAMLAEIEAGRVAVAIAKDLSRLGRISALTGLYTNFTFPQNGVRFIAINDNYDTIDPNRVDNDFAGIKNWFNEFYDRDTSRKIRAVQKAKGERGVPLTTNVPYGYVKDLENPRRWVVDPVAADVVKRIFDLCMKGRGPMQIANQLKADKVLTPSAYKRKSRPIETVELPIASAEVRDNTYSNLLSLLTLCPTHQSALKERGLKSEEMERLCYRTTPTTRLKRIVTELLERGCILDGVPGFYCQKDSGQWVLDIRGSGIMLPDRNLLGQIEAIQVRLDKVYNQKFYNLTSVDQYYGTQSKCCPHYVGVHVGDEVVCLTEGVMKSDLAYSFAQGSPYECGFVGLTGIPSYSQYERALEELDSIGVKRINVMVDSDYQVKEEVRKARDRYIEMGAAAGFEMAPITWTQKQKGVDDLYKHLFRDK